MSLGALGIQTVTENRHNFDSCKNIETDPPKPFKNIQQFPIHFSDVATWTSTKTKYIIKSLKQVHKIGPCRPEGSKTSVKVHTVLHKRLSWQRFLNSISEEKIESRLRAKYNVRRHI